VPNDFIRSSLVQDQTERRLVFPHLSSNVITPAKFIGEALAFLVEDKTSDTAKRFSCQEFDFGIRIVWLHKSCGMHLHPLKIHRFGTDSLSHLDAVTSAVLSVCGGEMHQVGSILGKQRIAGKVSTEATSCQNHRTVLLEAHTTLLVHESNNYVVNKQELVGASFRDDTGLVCSLCDLLTHLDKSISDCHARKSFCTTVRAGCRVPTKACN